MGSQFGRIGIQLIGTVVLSRMLGPEAFGIAAIALVVVGLSEIVRDSGLLNAAVQAPDLDVDQRDKLFWLNSALGVGLAALLAVAAPLIASVYGEPALTGLLGVLATSLVAN